MMTDLPPTTSGYDNRHTHPQVSGGTTQAQVDMVHEEDEEEPEQEQELELEQRSVVEVDDSAPLVEPHQDLDSFLESFWTRQMAVVERDNPDFRTYPLPLARIKKVMKSDEEVKVSHPWFSHCTMFDPTER
jgi:hypothetical protein